jgi:hypothetical protein
MPDCVARGVARAPRAWLGVVLGCGVAAASGTAWAAEPPGHYDPNAVASQSALFAATSEAMTPRFEAAQARASASAAALREFEIALDALGSRAPAEQRARYQELRRDYVREHRVLEAAVQEVAEDFDAAFQAAVQRALPEPGIVACVQPTGPLARLRAPETACAGPDRSAAIASRLDADPTLRAQLDAIGARGWPALRLDATPVAAIGPVGAPWVALGALLIERASEPLRAIDADDEAARADIDVAIEEGADAEELRGLRDSASRVDAATAERRASLAADLLAAVDALNARRLRQEQPEFSWCVQPALLGGCVGAPADRAALLADKRVERALSDAAQAR